MVKACIRHGNRLIFNFSFTKFYGYKCEKYFLTGIFGEANGERRLANFLLEKILFVQEENNRGVSKPFVIAN